MSPSRGFTSLFRCAIAGVAGSTLLYMKYLCTDAVSDQSMVALLFHTHSNERKHRKPRLRAIILFDDTVYCLDAASGNTFWKTTLAGIDLPARLGSVRIAMPSERSFSTVKGFTDSEKTIQSV